MWKIKTDIGRRNGAILKSLMNTIPVRIIKHLPLGLLVELPDKRRGIVRVRELSWDIEEQLHWKSIFPVDFATKAVIIKGEKERYLELSLRMAQKDPWGDITNTFHEGQTIEGIVTGVKNFGVFIEIAPGITGLLHQSELPDYYRGNVLDIFWPGDHARVRISKLDLKEKRISLSLGNLSIPSEELSSDSANLQSGAISVPPIRLSQKDVLADLLAGRDPLHILVVEDDGEQSTALSSWLSKLGLATHTAASAEEALSFLEQETPDIIITDIGLPGIDGIELARKVSEAHPTIRTILNTDWAKIENDFNDIEKLQADGVQLLVKPLLPEDLLLAIREERKGGLVANPSIATPESHWLQKISSYQYQQAIDSTLDECRSATRFDTAILFEFDPTSCLVNVVAKRGSLAVHNPAIDSLTHSPVRDVAEDGEMIVEVNINTDAKQRRFRYLETFIQFNACLAVPVRGQFSKRYTLFLFHNTPCEILETHQTYALATALVLNSILVFV